jgi:hypothetical protein
MNQALRTWMIQQKINLDKDFSVGQRDIVDDVAIVMIGGAAEDTEDTPVPMGASATVATLLSYTVPTGYKAILIKLRADKTAVGTDKNSTIQVCETTTPKIIASIESGTMVYDEEYPIHDHEFVAGKVVKLQAVTEAGAAGIFYAIKATLLVVKV